MLECETAPPHRPCDPVRGDPIAPEGGTRTRRRPPAIPGAALLLETAGAFAFYAALAAFYLRPIWRLFRDHLAPDLGDPLFNLYVLEWGMHQIRSGMPDLWNANFFHPVPDVLALSDHLVGPAFQALLLREVAGTSIGAYNLLLFTSVPLAGAATFWVLRQAGASRIAAFVGGLAFAFSHYRFSQLSHLQVFLIQWIPLVLWHWDRLLAEPRLRRALPFLLFYALHVTGGSYLAYMIHVPLAAIALNRLPDRRVWNAPRSRPILLATLLASAAVVATVFLPYLAADPGFDRTWGTLNYKVFGATSAALVTPGPLSPLFPVASGSLETITQGSAETPWFAEKSLFPGFVPGVLALAAVAALVVRHRVRPARPLSRRRRTALALLLAAALAAFAAADFYTLGWWLGGVPPDLQRPESVYTPCGVVAAAALAAWFVLRRRWGGGFPLRWTAMPPFDRGVLAIGGLCLALCFPAFYQPLTEVLPGLDRMRVPSRFYAFTTFATAFFAARGLDGLRRRLRRRQATSAGLAIAAWIAVEMAPSALPWHRVPLPEEFPPAHRWLAAAEEVHAVAELPIRVGVDELPSMIHSTVHWKPLVNGFSAVEPPPHRMVRETCASGLPEPPCLDLLRAIGVSHVVVHPVWSNAAKHRAFERWSSEVESGAHPGLRIVFADADPRGDRVIEIRGAAGRPASARKVPAPDSVP